MLKKMKHLRRYLLTDIAKLIPRFDRVNLRERITTNAASHTRNHTHFKLIKMFCKLSKQAQL